MNEVAPIVYVVDDDPRMREALENLLSSFGFRVAAFGTAARYIDSEKPNVPSCLILDIELPDMNGLDLQQRLAEAAHAQIVFITGHGDIPSSVRAMKAGAVDFLPKPFRDEHLLSAVESALARDRRTRETNAEIEVLRRRYRLLTPRERDVLPLVVSGLLNKQAAAKLGISVVTLQIHRGNVMRKMAASSLSELVRMAAKLGIGEDATANGSGKQPLA
jgi:FixJ family two-component response regulator